MKSFLYTSLAFFAIYYVFALPVDKKLGQGEVPNADPKVENEIDNLGLEYGRYLQEVVMALEEDKDFSKKLENISSEDIKSGKIAGELDFVHHSVRSKLDELKRLEIERLRQLRKQEMQLEEFGGSYVEQDGRKWRTVRREPAQETIDHHIKNTYEHLDHGDHKRFSKEDLHKLIVKATADLEELDRKRREDFKQYEMEKEFQYQEGLKNMSETERKEAEKKHDEQQQKHKNHPRIHHPGSKQQLEEVWREQDHMPKEEFNPKTFFNLHDLNSDGVLDQDEVEALLSLEIKKMYDPNNPEDDPNEMMEEYHRMREHIYKEADKDRDGLISRKEFLDLTARSDFDNNEGWKGLDEEPAYTPEELREFEKHRQQVLDHQQTYYVNGGHQGAPHHQPEFVPYQGAPNQPPPVGYQQGGAYQPQGAYPQYAQQQPPQYAQQPPQYHPQQPQYHPQQAQYQPQYQPPAGQPMAYQQPQIGQAGQPNYQHQAQQQPNVQYQAAPGQGQAYPQPQQQPQQYQPPTGNAVPQYQPQAGNAVPQYQPQAGNAPPQYQPQGGNAIPQYQQQPAGNVAPNQQQPAANAPKP